MTEQTPALSYAEFLAALAGHLRAHPDLLPPHITPGSQVLPKLQVPSTTAAPLVAWFASLGAVDLHVRVEDEYASVHAYRATIGGFACSVWGSVDGLQRHLVQGGMGIYQGGLTLTLVDLEYFAGHGTLPEAGER